MSLKTTEAITLRTYPYAEADRIVVFLSRGYGKVRGIARGARRMKSRFGSSLEPLSHVRLIFFARENQELASINSCDLLASHAGLRESLEGSYYCAYFAELLGEFSQEGEGNERLFRLALSVLETQAASLEARARYLESWLLRLEGVFPPFSECGRCGHSFEDGAVFIPSGGHEALCRKCAGPRDLRVGPEERAAFASIFSRNISRVDWSSWGAATLKNIGRLNSGLIQYHLEKSLKSDRFIRELNQC
ncbi:MAG TPA: DNA repair protein RecO [Acidobacteriota bacterium]|jgi:DNA repair protein RecO (recombination protein O)